VLLYSLSRAALRTTMRVGSRPIVEGLEHVPAEGAVLLAANHRSFIDSLVIPCVVPRRVTFLAKAEYFEGTGLRGAAVRTFFVANGAIPVHRDGDGDTQGTLQAALSVLEKGWALGVYPEGTRSRDGRLYRGRPGVAWLALTAGCPVVPVGLIGTDKVQPVGSRIPRPHRITVRFAAPLMPADYASAGSASRARAALTRDLMDAIAGLTGQPRASGYNQRPTEL
jgi:1-acyl-sn-glycerol-3-phosphate acyltransferase